MGASGEILPGVAEAWSVSDTGLKWTFQLDSEARWSDGHPLTAHDFVFGLRRQQSPATASPLAHFLYCLKNAKAVNSGSLPPERLGVSAVDAHTLELTLTQPFPFLLERLLYPIAYPIPKHVLENLGDSWVKAENWVSNGAYVLNRWNSQEYVELSKNPFFKDAAAVAVSQVRYYPLTEPATAYNRYLAGDMDIIHGYPHNLVKKLATERAQEVRNVPLQSIMYLVFNVQQAPFDDVRVREALSHAIDKERITQYLLGAGEIPSHTMAPPIVEGFATQHVSVDTTANSPETLLAEAGYNTENPLELTLRYISGEENKRVYVAIASMWEQVGVRTTLHHSNLATHFSDLQNGNFEVAQAGWFGENNPEHYIELLWSEIGPANYGNYASSRFDAAFEDARATPDRDQRLRLLARAEQIALSEYPVIPLYVTMTLNLVKPHVKGWQANGRNLHPVRFMSWQ